MNITKLSIRHLFGLFDYDIPFKTKEHITIVHGPNGFGKTALLRLINGFFNARYSELRQIPFRQVTFEFDDGGQLTVDRREEERARGVQSKVKLQFTYKRRGQTNTHSLDAAQDSRELPFPISAIDDLVRDLERVGPREWRIMSTGEVIGLDDVWERYADQLPLASSRSRTAQSPEWLTELRGQVPVRFIQTQRLLSQSVGPRRPNYPTSSSLQMRPAVSTYSDELVTSLKSVLAEYGSLSQSLDRTFPTRLVTERAEGLSLQQIRDKLAELERKRNRLTETGLLDKEKDVGLQQEAVSAKTKAVLSVYVADVEKKLGVFDQIAAKIDLVKRIVNNRFQFKNLAITKDHGFVFTTRSGKVLSPTDLSSGEQHEIVLLYELLFKVEPESLILIDEPEISLHVGWQMQFLKDLQEMTKLSRFQVLIATHSPQIISDRWDLTVELKGPQE